MTVWAVLLMAVQTVAVFIALFGLVQSTRRHRAVKSFRANREKCRPAFADAGVDLYEVSYLFGLLEPFLDEMRRTGRTPRAMGMMTTHVWEDAAYAFAAVYAKANHG